MRANIVDPNALYMLDTGAHNSLNPNNWVFQHDIRNSLNPKHDNMWKKMDEPAWYRRNRKYYYEEERGKQAKAWQQFMNRNSELPAQMQPQTQAQPWQGANSLSMFDKYANVNNVAATDIQSGGGGAYPGLPHGAASAAGSALGGILNTPIPAVDPSPAPSNSLANVNVGGGGGIGGPSFRGGGGPSVESPFITSLGDIPRPELPKDLGGGGNNNGGGGTGLWDGIKGMGAEGWANVIGGANALGNMYLGHQSLKLGKQRFNFEAGLARRNLANQAQMYNSAIERRARSNAASFGYEGQERDSYVDGIVDKEKVKGTI